MSPHQLMMFCLKLAGMVRITGGSLIKAHSYYFFTSFIVFGASLFVYGYVVPMPIMKKLQTIHYLIALIQIFFKFLSIFFNQREVVDILFRIEQLWIEGMEDPDNHEILERADKNGRRITKIFLFIFCGYYPLRTLNLLFKYLVLRRPPQPFLQGSWMPPFIEAKYVLSVFYQVAHSLCIGFTNASYSVFIIFLTLQISAQIRILRRILENTSPIEPAIFLHQRLTRLFIRINRLLSGLMFLELVLTSFYSCVCSFLIIQSLSAGGRELVDHVHVLLLVLIRSFMICYCGNIISKEGEKLHNSVYYGRWYEKPEKYRKSVIFILQMTTRQPFKYNYRSIMTMNMAQFMQAMQTTYSYLTILLSFS